MDQSKCAGNFFTNGFVFLILKRSDGYWDLPGGHLKNSETPKEGAKREAREEIGLFPSDAKLLGSVVEVKYTGFVYNVDIFVVRRLNKELSCFCKI